MHGVNIILICGRLSILYQFEICRTYPHKHKIWRVKQRSRVLKFFVNMLKGSKINPTKSQVPTMFGFIMRIFLNSVAEKG